MPLLAYLQATWSLLAAFSCWPFYMLPVCFLTAAWSLLDISALPRLYYLMFKDSTPSMLAGCIQGRGPSLPAGCLLGHA